MHPIARLPPGTGLRPAGRQLLVGAALAAAGARAQRPEMNCTYTSPSGDYYDIGPLVRASDFVISDSTGAHVFYWNSCGGVERRGEELGFQCDASDVACERGDAGRGRYYGLGKLDTVQFNTVYGRQGLLEARYTGGTETPTGPRRITVEIECDRNAEEPRFEMHHVPSAPNYLLTVKSVHGCVKEAPPAPSPADCRYVGPSGNSYDIGQLVNATSDWMFADTNGHYVYHWNSCSGLGEDLPPDPDTGQDCSAGPNGTPLCGCRAGIDAGCQVHSDDDFGPYSLGTLASAEYRETVASDGSTLLSAFYRDGAESATDPEWGARSMQVSTGSLFT